MCPQLLRLWVFRHFANRHRSLDSPVSALSGGRATSVRVAGWRRWEQLPVVGVGAVMQGAVDFEPDPFR